ncbi:MAG TPA: DNA repair protein RecO [Clostridiales bacterium]|nr:DNA repair protein RecO [Clostridiales bacterium]
MPASTTVTGMVLSAIPVGEYDKRLVILTKELGKISAFAKGARRQNSALLACSEPFSFGEFTLYVGRNSYSITSADISNYFPELRSDYEGLCHGLYFCEFADYITKEHGDETEVLKLLYQSLRALIKKTIEMPLIRAIFEFKMIALMGIAPQVFYCVKCEGRSDKDEDKENIQRNSRYKFSSKSGGILCESCYFHDKQAMVLDTSTLFTLQYIISKDVEKLYTFRVSNKVLNELTRIVKEYMKSHIDHEFKTLEMLIPNGKGRF